MDTAGMRTLVLALLAGACGEVVKGAEATCGDGIVNGAAEQCDTGGESAGCNDDCTRALCGDGKVNAMAGEACDDGDQIDTNECNNACTTFGTTTPPGQPFTSTGIEGPFAPVGDIVLSPGVHNFTTIVIPSGVTVSTSGYGALDLRATGDVVIDGAIDVSGGRGGDGSTGAMNTCDSGGGAGGGTGTRFNGASGAGVVDVGNWSESA